MAIHVRCPVCRNRRPYRNKKCSCGASLDSAKQSKKALYYVVYRVEGVQKVASAGKDLSHAKALDAQLTSFRYQGRLLDLVAKKDSSFNDIAEWYLGLPSVKRLKYYRDLKMYLKHFLDIYGKQHVLSIKADDLEWFQEEKRKSHSVSYVDKMIGSVQGMLTKAVNGEQVDRKSVV